MYRHNNFNFVVDSTFRPFSFEEMVQPLAIYKNAFEQAENAYSDLTDKSNKFKYLSETLPEGSKARQIYEGYANELNKQAEDLAKHGLNMGNRRSLTNLKRRYQGEIGRLISADEAMSKEKELRRTMGTKDSSLLYATDNLSIDEFLDNKNPNLYSVSGNELYARGAAAGKAASSRIYSAGDEGSTLNGYFRKWVERNGYNADSINAFRANAAAIPELQQAADAILAERGVNENLTGANLERARQGVLNGIIDGAVYSEKVNPVRDPGVMSLAERRADARASRSQAVSEAMNGITWENGKPVYNKEGDLALQRQKAILEKKAEVTASKSTPGKKGSNDKVTQLGGRIKLSWNSGNPEANSANAKDYKVSRVEKDKEEYTGTLFSYDDLPDNIKDEVDKIIGDGNVDMYNYYYKPHDNSAWWGGQPELEIEARDIKTIDADGSDEALLQSMFGG